MRELKAETGEKVDPGERLKVRPTVSRETTNLFHHSSGLRCGIFINPRNRSESRFHRSLLERVPHTSLRSPDRVLFNSLVESLHDSVNLCSMWYQQPSLFKGFSRCPSFPALSSLFCLSLRVAGLCTLRCLMGDDGPHCSGPTTEPPTLLSEG